MPAMPSVRPCCVRLDGRRDPSDGRRTRGAAKPAIKPACWAPAHGWVGIGSPRGARSRVAQPRCGPRTPFKPWAAGAWCALEPPPGPGRRPGGHLPPDTASALSARTRVRGRNRDAGRDLTGDLVEVLDLALLLCRGGGDAYGALPLLELPAPAGPRGLLAVRRRAAGTTLPRRAGVSACARLSGRSRRAATRPARSERRLGHRGRSGRDPRRIAAVAAPASGSGATRARSRARAGSPAAAPGRAGRGTAGSAAPRAAASTTPLGQGGRRRQQQAEAEYAEEAGSRHGRTGGVAAHRGHLLRLCSVAAAWDANARRARRIAAPA